jgi:hypothetical protein
MRGGIRRTDSTAHIRMVDGPANEQQPVENIVLAGQANHVGFQTVVVRLEIDRNQDRRFGLSQQRKHFLQSRYPLLTKVSMEPAARIHLLEFRQGLVSDLSFTRGRTVERLIVKADQHPVATSPHI